MNTHYGPGTILVIDDELLNYRVFESMLTPLGYTVRHAPNGIEGLEMVAGDPPDVILLDVMMPGMNGYEVTRRLKNDPSTLAIPVVIVTTLKDLDDRVRALDAGADDFLTKPVDSSELCARVRSLMKVKAYNDHMRTYQQDLERQVEIRTREMQNAFRAVKNSSLDTIFRLSRAAVYKDEGTGAHIKRIALYASAIARRMGMDDESTEMLLYAAPMHDVGKIGIPDRILLKPGKLDPYEWEVMKQHTVIGARILEGSDTPYLRRAEIIALNHHEKWDGSGYPRGLKGTDIPVEARITAVADVFDALTTERPYKRPFALDVSLDMIVGQRGAHFEPALVDIFLDARDEMVAIMNDYRDEQESTLYTMSGLVGAVM